MNRIRSVFYSADGVIWYWGRYTSEDLKSLRLAGWAVRLDTVLFRLLLN